ncbi:hypothetical protein EV361DRAFT_511425 [Lentinula raphanica]|nr:hypothetical protein F5880DRAFT_793014 [Lentinula raphanica]KAJ3967203.1 hypothetical protein EV361DRAFT_511425 [Lentinula raphanica]
MWSPFSLALFVLSNISSISILSLSSPRCTLVCFYLPFPLLWRTSTSTAAVSFPLDRLFAAFSAMGASESTVWDCRRDRDRSEEIRLRSPSSFRFSVQVHASSALSILKVGNISRNESNTPSRYYYLLEPAASCGVPILILLQNYPGSNSSGRHRTVNLNTTTLHKGRFCLPTSILYLRKLCSD